MADVGTVDMTISAVWFPYSKNCKSYIEVLKQPELVSLRQDLSSVKV